MKRKRDEYEIPFDGKAEEEKLYIVPERYQEQKRLLKNHLDCRNETIADVVHVGWRMCCAYIAGKHHIPKDRLLLLSTYLGVNPDWLVGKSEQRIVREIVNESWMVKDLNDVHKWVASHAMSEYLRISNIQSDKYSSGLYASTDPDTEKRTIDTTTGGTENPYYKYREVNGVVLSYNEYKALIEELRLIVDFAADRFVKNIVASRNNFERDLPSLPPVLHVQQGRRTNTTDAHRTP